VITGLNDRVERDRSLLRLWLLLGHLRYEEKMGKYLRDTI
jgi:hypothetical protein